MSVSSPLLGGYDEPETLTYQIALNCPTGADVGHSTPETKEIFAGFEFERVSVTYTVSRDAAKQSPELIVSNRKIEGDLFSEDR